MSVNEVLRQAGLRARYNPEAPAPHQDPILAALEAAEAELGIKPELPPKVEVQGDVYAGTIVASGEPGGEASNG